MTSILAPRGVLVHLCVQLCVHLYLAAPGHAAALVHDAPRAGRAPRVARGSGARAEEGKVARRAGEAWKRHRFIFISIFAIIWGE